jgi:hypothetical protein
MSAIGDAIRAPLTTSADILRYANENYRYFNLIQAPFT